MCERKWIGTAALAAALMGCTPASGVASSGGATDVASQITLKSTTALSLAELAYNSGEAAATAALRSGHLSQTDASRLGDAVHTARDARDRARAAVAAGGDAAAAIGTLAAALSTIHTLAGQQGEG